MLNPVLFLGLLRGIPRLEAPRKIARNPLILETFSPLQAGHFEYITPLYPQSRQVSTGWFIEPYPMPESFMHLTILTIVETFFFASPSSST